MANANAKKKRAEQTAPQPGPTQAEQELKFRHTLDRVRRAANSGDGRAQRAIKECVRNSPDIAAEFGDVARHAEMAIIDLLSGGEALTAAAVTQHAADLRWALAGPSPSPLEELAVRRLVSCWLQVQYTDTQFFSVQQQNLGWARYWLRRQEQAHKLFAAAQKSLLLIRSLLPGAVRPQVVIPVGAIANEPQAVYVPVVQQAETSPQPVPTGQHSHPHDRVNGYGANRIAHLAAGVGDAAPDALDADPTSGPPRTNGHHHRLGEFLVPAGHGGE